MYLEIILTIIIFRYLRKSLQTGSSFAKWDKPLLAGMAGSIAVLIMYTLVSSSRSTLIWLPHLALCWLVYTSFYKKEFHSAKSMTYAVLPYLIIAVLADLTRLISVAFYNSWVNYFESARVFAVIWMASIWFITKRQRTALDIERQKTREKEQENQMTESLKAALEVQVAERTAALTQQKEELQLTLTELKATQAQLIQSEKMASLGELTAGIAHEIQNPLNFVNNFSELNIELISEMSQEIDKGDMHAAKAVVQDIIANEQKINYHGKRADAIVKGMLQHSRNSGGIKELTDINALADEYLRLAFHGLRAKDKSFNAMMITDFDERIGKINIIPQDIGRVILNLITNAFYAVAEKKTQLADGYEPTVWVSTKKTGNNVSITVRDNGNGIPSDVLDKIFQPFFTTKPTGQGTGLGLSMSYDIVTKGHGGELQVESKIGEGARFTINLSV